MHFILMNSLLICTLFLLVGSEVSIRFQVNGFNLSFNPNKFSEFFICLNTTRYSCNVTLADNESELIVLNTTSNTVNADQQLCDSLSFSCTAPTDASTRMMTCTRDIELALPTNLDTSKCNRIKYKIENETDYTFEIIFQNGSELMSYIIMETLDLDIQQCFSRGFDTSSQVKQTSDEISTIPIFANSLSTIVTPFIFSSDSTNPSNSEIHRTSDTFVYSTEKSFYESSSSECSSAYGSSISDISPTQTSNDKFTLPMEMMEISTFGDTTSTSVTDSTSAEVITEIYLTSSDDTTSQAGINTPELGSASLVTYNDAYGSKMEQDSTISIDSTSIFIEEMQKTTTQLFKTINSTEPLVTINSLGSTFAITPLASATINSTGTSTTNSSLESTFVPTSSFYTKPKSIDTSFSSLIPNLLPASILGSNETPLNSLTSTLLHTTSTYFTLNSMDAQVISLTSTLLPTIATSLTLNPIATPPLNVTASTFPWNTTEKYSAISTPIWQEVNQTANTKQISVSENITSFMTKYIAAIIETSVPYKSTSSLISTQSFGNETQVTTTAITVSSVTPTNATQAAAKSLDEMPIIVGTVVGFTLLAFLSMICCILIKKRKKDQILKRSKRYKGLKDNYEMVKMNPKHGMDPPKVSLKPQNKDSKPKKWSQPTENVMKINPALRKFSDPGPQSKPEYSNKIALRPPRILSLTDQTSAVTNEKQASKSKNFLQIDLSRGETSLPVEVNEIEGIHCARLAGSIGNSTQPNMQPQMVEGDITTYGVHSQPHHVKILTNGMPSTSSMVSPLSPDKAHGASRQISDKLNVDVLIAGLESSINKKNNIIKKQARKPVEKLPSEDGTGYATISVTGAGDISDSQNSSPVFMARQNEKLKAADAESVYSTVMCEDVSEKTMPNFNFGSTDADDDGYTTVDSDSVGGKAGSVSSKDKLRSPLVEQPETSERSSVGGLYATVELNGGEEEVTPRLNRSKDRHNIKQINPERQSNNYSVIWPRHVQSDHLGSPVNKHKPVLLAGKTISELGPGASHDIYSTLHTETRLHQNPYSTILDFKKHAQFKNGIESQEKSAIDAKNIILLEGPSKVNNPAKRNYTIVNIGSENVEGNITSVKVTPFQQEETKSDDQKNNEETMPGKRLSDSSYSENENVYFELEKETAQL